MRYDLSVLVPCYNVKTYLRQCLDSIVNQTFKNIEIICINDGSTDNTLEIIEEYAANDSRFKIVDKPNSGYGNSMNCGLKAATGEYIGIVESDDYIELDMFEKLYNTAKKFDADVVKSNFFFFWTEPELREEKHEYFALSECNKPIKPLEHQPYLFRRKPSIWSAIYKREFLTENDIDFLETPGASFQDTSFTFKVYSNANMVIGIHDYLLHYRQDNINSSVNNLDKKWMYVVEEYDEIQKMLDLNFTKNESIAKLKAVMFYDTCIWTYERLSPNCRYDFLQLLSKKFAEIDSSLGISKLPFDNEPWKFKQMRMIKDTPFEYLAFRYEEDNGFLKELKLNLRAVAPTPQTEKPYFSIIVPVYKVELFLRTCLDSLINQTFENIEIICVNDGSPDNCLDILLEYAELDKRIIIVNKDNGGLSSARNAGMKIAKGEYMLLVDSDDYISVDACKVLYSNIMASENNIDVCIFGTRAFAKGKNPNEWLLKTLTVPDKFYKTVSSDIYFSENYFKVFSWRFCLKTEFCIKNDIYFDETVCFAEDAIYGLDLFKFADGILCISNKLYNYRFFRKDSLMNTINKNHDIMTENFLIVVDKIKTKIDSELTEVFLQYILEYIYSTFMNSSNKDIFAKIFLDRLNSMNSLQYIQRLPKKFRDFYEYILECSKNVEHFRKEYDSKSKIIFGENIDKTKRIKFVQLNAFPSDWSSSYFVIDISIMKKNKKLQFNTLNISFSTLMKNGILTPVVQNIMWEDYKGIFLNNIFYEVKEKSIILYAKPIENAAISWNIKTVQSRDVRYPLFKSLNSGKIENFNDETDDLLNITECISSGNAKLFKQISYAQNKILEYEFFGAD